MSFSVCFIAGPQDDLIEVETCNSTDKKTLLLIKKKNVELRLMVIRLVHVTDTHRHVPVIAHTDLY